MTFVSTHINEPAQENTRVTGGQAWYALWVRSRHEFVTARELTRKGVENFVPSISRVRQWKDRKKNIEFALFPGYLFVHVYPGAETFLNIVTTHGAVRFISQEPGRPIPVPADDIVSLKLMLACGEQLDVLPGIKEGTLVRVKRGPLCGAVGVLCKRGDHQMFLVNFDLLGRSVGVKIFAEDIEQA